MTNDIKFGELVSIYDEADFGGDGFATISVSSEQILGLLKVIDRSAKAAEDSQISIVDDVESLVVGGSASARIAEPRISLGLLAIDFDALLLSPLARTREPGNFYIVDGRVTKDRHHYLLPKYRSVLSLVEELSKAATYFDGTKQELVFLNEGRFDVPVNYGAEDLGLVNENAVEALLNILESEIHGDQKKEILATAVVGITAPIGSRERFKFLLRNLEELRNEVDKGYRLFISNFSYRKIRGEIEDARLDYIGRIHKTFVDIQSQLLAIPVATIVVASQLRSAPDCGIESWTNVAVIAGTWVFAVLLLIAVVNQWVTLNVIGTDVARQKGRLHNDFPAIENQFVDVFSGLLLRVCWHKFGLLVVAVIAIGGGLLTSIVYQRVTEVAVLQCI